MNPLIGDIKKFYWSPIKVNDIRWNFEKFLITADGTPFRRYIYEQKIANQKPQSQSHMGLTIRTDPMFSFEFRYEIHCPIEKVEKDIAELL